MRRLPAFGFVLALAAATPRVHAHGGLFRPDALRVAPDNPAHMLVRSDVWGLMETRDGGASWQWFCAEAVFGDSVTITRRPYALLPGGTALVASSPSGLYRSGDTLCDFEPVAFFQEAGRCGANPCLFYDVTLEGARADSALVVTAELDADSRTIGRLWRSQDGAASWSVASEPMPVGVLATGARAAPSDPQVFYAAGIADTAPEERVLLASADGGQSWSPSAFATPAREHAILTARVHAVHPQDPSFVVVWLDYDAGSALAADAIVVSADGGTTLTTVFEGSDDLPGFAFSPDGTRLFIGGPSDGLLSASVDDLRAGRTDAFEVVNAGPTWALAWAGESLWAGREEYALDRTTERMTLGVSQDLGATFEPGLVICDVSVAECPSESRSGAECPDMYYGDNNFRYDHQLARCAAPVVDGGPPPVGGAADGGTRTGGDAEDGAGEDGGCGCRAAPRGPGGLSWLGAFLAALFVRRFSRSGLTRRARARSDRRPWRGDPARR